MACVFGSPSTSVAHHHDSYLSHTAHLLYRLWSDAVLLFLSPRFSEAFRIVSIPCEPCRLIKMYLRFINTKSTFGSNSNVENTQHLEVKQTTLA